MKVERTQRGRQQRQQQQHHHQQQPQPAAAHQQPAGDLTTLTAMASLAPATLPTQPQPQFTLPTQPYQMQTTQQAQQQQVMMMHTGVTTGQKLIRRGHQMELLHNAKVLCDRQDYVDLTIYCDDGVVRAHQMLLAVASPFLKLLFQTSPLYGLEDLTLILPETKVCLVQALIHFVYTGTVVTREDHFYSLMKLVYALNVNASIEAESTNDRPTVFSAPLVPMANMERVRRLPHQNSMVQHGISLPTQPLSQSIALGGGVPPGSSANAVAAAAVAAITQPAIAPPNVIPQPPSKMPRLMGPPANSVPLPPQSLSGVTGAGTSGGQKTTNLPIQLPTQPVPVINGVAVKGEQPSVAAAQTGGSYIAIDPNTGMQYKVELPNGQLGDGLSSDPLAAIMNETIFTETSGGTMFTTENGQVIYTSQAATVPTTLQPQQMQQLQQQQPAQVVVGPGTPGSANQKRGKKRQHKENAVLADSVDDLPCAPDDEDLNTPYQCETCNKTIKGRVMLQAHQYQEHYENPDMGRIGEVGDKHACRVCLKLFTRNSDVKAHILRVHCGDRRYPCTMCGKRFKESTHLRKHLYTHTGERPHFCKLCSKGFQTSSDLKRHKRTRVHQERVEQVAAAGGDIEDDEAIITGTGTVPNAVVDGSAGVGEESGNGGDILMSQQQPSTTTSTAAPTTASISGFSSTIDMKDLGGGSTTATAGAVAAATATTTAPTPAAVAPSIPVNTNTSVAAPAPTSTPVSAVVATTAPSNSNNTSGGVVTQVEEENKTPNSHEDNGSAASSAAVAEASTDNATTSSSSEPQPPPVTSVTSAPEVQPPPPAPLPATTSASSAVMGMLGGNGEESEPPQQQVTPAPPLDQSEPSAPAPPITTASTDGNDTTTSAPAEADPTVASAEDFSAAPPPPPPLATTAEDASSESKDMKRSSSVDSPGQDEQRLTVVEGDDSSQDSASGGPTTTAGATS